MRSTVWVLSLIASLTLARPAPASGVRVGTVAEVEEALSTPTCGVGWIETRTDQLMAFKGIDHQAVLVQIAHSQYDGDERKYLPMIAVEVLANLGNERARLQLQAIAGNPTLSAELRILTAQRLATAFGDSHGFALLEKVARSGEVQDRADCATALLTLDDADALDAVAPLISDPSSYVVDRIAWQLTDEPAPRTRFLAAAERWLETATADQVDRAVVTRLILGDRSQTARAEEIVSSWAEPATNQVLYNQASLCEALVERGHSVGLSCATRVIERFEGLEDAGWYNYAVSVAADHSPYERTFESAAPAEEARALRAWLSENPKLTFDADKGFFTPE